jgi:hypothetical protein
MTPEELLLKAAEDQAERGHHKGTYYKGDVGDPAGQDREAPACAYGSLTRAATNGEMADYSHLAASFARREAAVLIGQAARLLADSLVRDRQSLNTFDPFDVITRFNDHRSTTAEDVILAFKRAAHGD